MGQTSNFGFILNLDPDAFGEDQPCDVYDAVVLRNNIAHMIDSAPPTYINWAATKDNSDSSAILATSGVGAQMIWSQAYVHRWTKPDRPSSVHLYLAARVNVETTSTLTARARIVPARFNIGDLSAPALLDASATLTPPHSAGFELLFDEYVFATVPRPDMFNSFQTFELPGEGGTAANASVSMMRLEITAFGDTAEFEVEIGYMLLRGFG